MSETKFHGVYLDPERPLVVAARKVAQAALAAREAGESEVADQLQILQDRLAAKLRAAS